MKHLRHSTIALLIGLTIFFNIERLDFRQEDIVDIDSFVYVLGLLVVLSAIASPALFRRRPFVPLTLWLSVYLTGKWLLPNTHPLLGGLYSYITITEASLLAILVLLAFNLAANLQDFEQAIGNILFANGDRRIRRFDTATEVIEAEMFRSRRYQRPLTVMVIEPEPESAHILLDRAVEEARETLMNHYALTNLARIFSQKLRRTDLILEQHEHGRFVLLCPETNETEATYLARRMQTEARQHGISIICGAATFPDEALTFEELVRQAEAHFQTPAVIPAERLMNPIILATEGIRIAQEPGFLS